MRTVRTVAAVRAALDPARAAGRTVGLVPTMGALHEGHLSLMRRARAECDMVVVSIFVNPAQFAPGEDLAAYPRDERLDAARAAEEGIDVLFAPSAEEVYPDGHATTVEVSGVSEVLCGAPESRGPEHFRGVATVVTKLFNICRPDVAYFGAKDFQQSVVIRHLVRDLDLPVRIEVCPTVRDPDGLALSSRNAYLDEGERERALSLKRSLDAAAAVLERGGNGAAALVAAESELSAAGVTPEYLQVLRADDLAPPRWAEGERLVIAVAARLGRARLIDNAVTQLPKPPPDRDPAGRAAEPVAG